MKKPTVVALNARACLSSSSSARQDGKLTSCCEVVNYLPETYAAGDIIAEADMDIMNFTQPTGQSTVEYGQALLTNALRCGRLRKMSPPENNH